VIRFELNPRSCGKSYGQGVLLNYIRSTPKEEWKSTCPEWTDVFDKMTLKDEYKTVSWVVDKYIPTDEELDRMELFKVKENKENK